MRKLLSVIVIALCSVLGYAQPWTPFLTTVPSGSKGVSQTAIDWSLAGLSTGDKLPPDASWTQSGSTITAASCGNGASDCTSTIQTALNACGTNHYVLLGTGTFKLSSATPITIPSSCVLRGSGTLVASRTTINITSNIQDGTIRLGTGGDPTVGNAVAISSGATAGSTSIVVANATNFVVGSNMTVNELNDYSYVSTPPGSATNPTDTSLLSICPGTGSISSGSNVFTCGSSVFTSRHVNGIIQVPGAGAAGATLTACIASQTGTTATLKLPNTANCSTAAAANASTTLTGNAVLAQAGTPSENGGTGPIGCTYCDGLWSGTRVRGQTVTITGVSGTTITFSPPLYTDYTLTPQALPFTVTTNAGVESLYFTESGTHTNRNSPVGFNRCDNCWLTKNQMYFMDGDYAKFYWSAHCAVMFNYFDDGDNHGPGSDNQAVNISFESSANWVVSNIFVRSENTVLWNFVSSGNVIAYNYATGSYGLPTTIIVGNEGHSTHTQFNLIEGNIDAQNWYDVGHGTNSQHTSFRNWWIGTNLFCGGANTKATVNCTSPVWTYEYNVGLRIDSLSFYINSIGDVVGSPAMEALGGSKFSVKAWPTSRNTGGTGDDKIELSYGYTLQSDTGSNPFDSTTVQSQAFIHGLYSNHSGTTTWSGAITHTLPASFFLASKPSWWGGTLPYPGIGPDITGGTIPAAATAGPSPGGHVNANPAMNCYYSSMNGKEGGDGSPYDTFDANTCYSSVPLVATPTFSPVAGTYASSQSVTISTGTAGATLCYTTDGSAPTANGAGTCTHGTTYSGAVTVAVSETLKAVGSKTGFTDSPVGSAAYVIRVSSSTPTFSPGAGAYSPSVSVVISTTSPGAIICYNTTGSPATDGGTGCTTGNLYTGPVTVSISSTLFAIAGGSIYNDSGVGSAVYTISGGQIGQASVSGNVVISGSVIVK